MIIFYYIAGFLTYLALLLGWFKSGLPLFLSKKILRKDFEKYWQIVDYVEGRFELLGKILGCPLCFGFWLAIFVSSVISLIGGFGVLYVVLSIGWILPIIYFEKEILKSTTLS